MTTNAAIPVSSFDMALRSLQTGGITYRDFLREVSLLLASGIDAAELRERIIQREAIEPLHEQTRIAVLFFIDNWPLQTEDRAAGAHGPAGELVVTTEADTIVLEEEGAANDDADTATRVRLVAVGDVLVERFELIESIGEGGMSHVYKAVDLQAAAEAPDRMVALKLLTRPIAEGSAVFTALQREVQKLRSLVHPNIVRVYECQRDTTAVFITMQLLEGASLYSVLRSASVLDGVSIVKQIAAALDYAHQKGVVHGDLKPGNVMIHEGRVTLIDFGIAALVDRPRSAMERRESAQTRNALAVTPRYASPQLMARNSPTPKDDVYAIACLAYELLTGQHPFDAGADGQPLTFPPPPRPGLSANQYTAIVNGLQFERQNRTADARTFIAQFDTEARGEVQSRRSRAAGTAAVVGVIVVGALIGWSYHRFGKEAAPVAPVPAPIPTVTSNQPGNEVRDCRECAPVRVLPAGSFRQGAAADDATAAVSDKPAHDVTLAAPFAVSVDAVTVGDYAKFVADTGRDVSGCEIYDGSWHMQADANWSNPGFEQAPTHPVTCVSWNDAVAYAEWFSAKSGHRYRLPSASEWEYASRAGSEAAQPWTSDTAAACNYANVADGSAARRYPGWKVFGCDDHYVFTAPVGSFRANAFGLNDMLGNVFQWTQDCWYPDFANAPTDGAARTGGSCAEHELRGGSWFSTPKVLSAAHRSRFTADHRTSSVGFRLVRRMDE